MKEKNIPIKGIAKINLQLFTFAPMRTIFGAKKYTTTARHE